MQPHDPALRADDFNGPVFDWAWQPHFLKCHFRGHAITLQTQPFAQRGQPDTVLGGKCGLSKLTFVETRQQSLPLLMSPTPPSRTSFCFVHANMISEPGVDN